MSKLSNQVSPQKQKNITCESSKFGEVVAGDDSYRLDSNIQLNTKYRELSKHLKSNSETRTKPPQQHTGESVGVNNGKLLSLASSSVPRTRYTGSNTTKVPPGRCSTPCFEGNIFAVTGTFHSLGRQGVEDLIKAQGGKVATTVSSRTSFLVIGDELEDGRPVEKSNKFKEVLYRNRSNEHETSLGTEIRRGSKISRSKTKKGNSSLSPLIKILTEKDLQDMVNDATTKNEKSVYTKETENVVSEDMCSSPGPKAVNTSSLPHCRAPQEQDFGGGMLWVDKYAPSNSGEILGNGDMIKKLTSWLRSWQEVHIAKTRPIPTNYAKAKEQLGAKAVLLSGPPGIGKSTMATLISKHEGYETVEFNASDVRSKGRLVDELSGAIFSGAMSMSGVVNRKRLIIMDEVDGMGGNEDRGGIQELISLIKKSKVPFICICNDRQHQKIRSLEKCCYDLRMRRPTKQVIAKRAVDIAGKEGLDLEVSVMLFWKSAVFDVGTFLPCQY